MNGKLSGKKDTNSGQVVPLDLPVIFLFSQICRSCPKFSSFYGSKSERRGNLWSIQLVNGPEHECNGTQRTSQVELSGLVKSNPIELSKHIKKIII